MVSGCAAILFVGFCVFGALVGLVFEAGSLAVLEPLKSPYVLSVIRFTLWQAGLSTVLSLLLALPLARALHRRPRFFGRSVLMRLTSVSLVVPTMVAILGIVGVHGRSGWVNEFLMVLGFGRQDYLYGLNGILIAHVFFNLPLVTRIFLNGLAQIPENQWRLAQHLGITGRHLMMVVEWPSIRKLIPGAAGIVFLLCFTSFAIVLALGGGPQSTTLEVAIYQAVRFDFDLSAAVALSFIQITLCLVLGWFFFSSSNDIPLGAEHRSGAGRPDANLVSGRIVDWAMISFAVLFLLSPFVSVLVKVFEKKGWVILSHPTFLLSLKSSITIAVLAGLIATVLALTIAQMLAIIRLGSQGRLGKLGRHTRALGTVPELVSMMTLIVPPITLGTGLFLLLRGVADISTLGLPLVIVINGLFALPFALRILVAPVHQQRQRFDRLTQNLGITGYHQWRWVYWPGLRRPMGYGLAVTTTLSLGDMGVIALFGTDELTTLPLLIYRLLGNYRLDQAAVVAVILCGVCLVFFLTIERLVGGRAEHADVNH